MVVSRTYKAVTSVAASVAMSGLLVLADPTRASADSLWDGVAPVCTLAGSSAGLTAPAPRECLDDSLWD